MPATAICNLDLNPSPALPPDLPWRERRDWLRGRLEACPQADLSLEEIQVHFAGMPAHYWERVNEADLLWGLETIHGFLELVASPQHSPTSPFVTWRSGQDAGCLRVMLCTWDRHGLLAKAAASFSAVRLNILQADIFTRADNIVLDEFSITAAGGRSAVDEARLKEMTFLLDGALSEPPRFASIWACSRHKFLATPSLTAPKISCDNTSSSECTVVQVQAADRLGLLYDILQAIAEAGLNVTQARIDTEGELARDTIHVTNAFGNKLADGAELDSVRARLQAALTVSD